jgi:signal peptidase II
VANRPGANRTLGLVTAATVFVTDQLSKWLVTHPLDLPNRGLIDVVPIFDLRWVNNTGVSLGMLSADTPLGRWLLVALTMAIAAVVAVWLWRERQRDDAFGLGLILGGALGNILDRVRFGHVVDFLDLHIGDWHPFLIFNPADAAITIGVLILLLRALLVRQARLTETK